MAARDDALRDIQAEVETGRGILGSALQVALTVINGTKELAVGAIQSAKAAALGEISRASGRSGRGADSPDLYRPGQAPRE